MRSNIVFVLLLGLLGTMGFLIVKHSRSAVPVVMPAAPHAPDAGGHPLDAGSPVEAGASPPAPDAAPPAPAMKMDRPLKVTGLGWDLLAAGIAENGGVAPSASSGFTKAGVDVHFTASPSMERLESRLVTGGTEAEGADVALLPLPLYVASYERLRALEPEVLLVVGWSRGRETLVGKGSSLLHLSKDADVELVKGGSESATLLGLFILDLAGTPLSHVRLLSPSEDPHQQAAFAALDRSRSDDAGGRHLLVTTADASRLIPLVAIASHGFLEAHGPALKVWAQGWMRGVQRLRKDLPAAARDVAAIDGAPDAVALLVGLGQIEPATVKDNAELMALSGRGVVTLARTFESEWRLWRGAGVLSTPVPDVPPIFPGVVMALARSEPPADATTETSPSGDAASTSKTTGAPVVLVSHAEASGKLDEPAVVSDVGWIAGIFAHAVIRVTASGKAATARIVASAVEQYALPSTRVVAGQATLGTASAVIEVMAAP